MTIINGARTIADISASKQVVDMSKDIALLDPTIAPFVTIVKQVKNEGIRVAKASKIEWLEDDFNSVNSVSTASATTTATTIAVANGALFRPGDIVNVPATGENVFVSSVTGDNLTVVRDYDADGGVTGVIVPDATPLLIIGNAMAENSTTRERLSTVEVAKYNYTQIFRTPIELSNTAKESDMYGGSDRAYQRVKALQEHKRDIANSMYFGQKRYDTNAKRRTMGGLLEFIKQGDNAVAYSSGGTTFTHKNFLENTVKDAFAHGSDQKLMICGGTTIAGIDAWALDKAQGVMTSKIFGVTIKKIVTSFGILNVLYDPALAGAIYGGYGMILDMDCIQYSHLKNRDTKLNTNIQANDQDGVMDEYITECSLVVKNPNRHAYFSGAYVV